MGQSRSEQLLLVKTGNLASLSESDRIAGSPPPGLVDGERLQRPKMKPCTSRQGRQDDLFKENKNFPAGRRG
jgi:hypothetical protein